MEGLGLTLGRERTPQARSWSGRRVLVTGATGVVGSWLVKELLAAGAHVVAFVLDPDPQSELTRSGDIRDVSVATGELENLRALERAVNVHGVDTVFHLGAQTLVEAAGRFPLGTWEANVRGTYHVLEVCRLHADLVERVVVASSDKAYGASDALPYTEDAPLAPRHPYEVSKACADLISQSYHSTYGTPVGIARCGNVYGGGDLNWSRIVPGTIRSLLLGQRPVLRSDGTYLRDYIFVKDAVRGYMRLAERLDDERVAGEAFNFGNESPVSVLEVVETIRRLIGDSELDPVIEDRAVGEIPAQTLSAGKAREVLGWEPEYDLESGLVDTAAWYAEYFGIPVPSLVDAPTA